MRQFNPLDPFGAGQRVLNALATLVGIAFCLHLIGVWLGPFVPVIIAISIVVVAFRIVLARHRR